jgi:hypothetical protein
MSRATFEKRREPRAVCRLLITSRSLKTAAYIVFDVSGCCLGSSIKQRANTLAPGCAQAASVFLMHGRQPRCQRGVGWHWAARRGSEGSDCPHGEGRLIVTCAAIENYLLAACAADAKGFKYWLQGRALFLAYTRWCHLHGSVTE